MPGLAGIITDKRIGSLFDHFLKSMNHFDYKIEKFSEKNVNIGGVYLKNKNSLNKMYLSEDNNFICFVNGEIFLFNNERIENDAQFILNEYIQNGLKNIKYIDGQFSAVIYDKISKSLILLNDRYGTHPLYYAQEGISFYFSTEVKAILKSGIKKEINYNSISDLFHYGHLFGYKTMFNDIHQLPEASYLIYQNNNIAIDRYWEFPFYEKAYFQRSFNKQEINHYLDEMIDVMSNSIKSQVNKDYKRIILSLSGGLDSRWVAALSVDDNNRGKIESFTMGEENSEDIIYAKMVANKLRIKHKSFAISPFDIWEDAKTYAYVSDYMSMINGPIQGFRPLQYFSNNADITLSSQMCDALYGSTLSHKRVKFLLNQKKWNENNKAIFLKLFIISSNSTLRLIFNDSVFEKIGENYIKTAETYINDYNIIMHAYYNILMNEHGRRGTLGGNLLNNLFFDTRMPSYNNRVIEFGYKLPITLKKNQLIYRKAFNILFPLLAAIPRESTGLPLTAPEYQINLKKMENRLINRIKKTKFSSVISKFNRWNKPSYVSYASWFQNELRNKMMTSLTDLEVFKGEIFNIDGINTIIEQHLKGEKDHSRLLWQIINLKYFWEENFI